MVIRCKKDLIYKRLHDDIASGFYALGEKLPPELEFAKELNTSFITLRSALKRLEEEKLIQRIRGRGTFVVSRPVPEKESRRLLLIYPGSEDTISQNMFNRHLFSGLAEVCAGLGDTVVSENISSCCGDLIERFKGGDFSGIIWDRPAVDNSLLQQLDELGVPQVTVNRSCAEIPSVSCDYIGAVSDAVRSLKRFGHRYIGLCDFGLQHEVLGKRSRHFAALLKENGIEHPEHYVMAMFGRNDEEKMAEIKRCMQGENPPTAVLVSHTYFSFFERYIIENDIKIPEELSVVQWGEEDGYDRFNGKPYSILSEPRIEAGRRAADIFYRILRGEDVRNKELLISTEFILRDGCSIPSR
ncbi:MAG: GntR family transcriptional regulator [Lentisphaeria bacterium]|nr:GntR family transcriptional regulator [Lentisphaeria bacterium]